MDRTRRRLVAMLFAGGSMLYSAPGCGILGPDFYVNVVNQTPYRLNIKVDGRFIGDVEPKDSREFPLDVRYLTYWWSDPYGGGRQAVISVFARATNGLTAEIHDRMIRAGRGGQVETFVFTPQIFRS